MSRGLPAHPGLWGALRSLRARVLLLVLLVTAPAAVLVWLDSTSDRGHVLGAQSGQALFTARLVAAQQAEIVQHVEQTLSAALAGYTPAGRHDPGCDAVSRAHFRVTTGLLDMGIATPRGRIVCSVGRSRAAGSSIAGETWFRRALAERQLVVGGIVETRGVRRPAVPVAIARRGAGGQVEAVAFAALAPDALMLELPHNGLPEGTRLLLLSVDLTVLSAYPPPYGRSLPRNLTGLAATTRPTDATSGYVDGRDRNGVRLLGAYAVVEVGGPGSRQIVYIGIEASKGVARIETLFWIALGTVLALLAGGLALAWFGGGVLLVRPARAIAVTARRLAEGDLSARTGVAARNSELALLAADIDAMADDLERRTHAVESERALYQSLVENLPAIVLEEPGGAVGQAVVQRNDPFGLGNRNRTMTSEEWIARIHPDDQGMYRDIASAGSAAGEPFRASYRRVMPDGQLRWFRVISVPIGDPAEGRRQSIHFDVTDEHLAHEALLRTTRHLEELGRIARAVLTAAALPEVAEEALAAVRELVGASQASVEAWDDGGRRCLARFPPDGAPPVPSDEERLVLEWGGTVRVSGDRPLYYLPLRAHGVTLGAFAISGEDGELDGEALDFLETVARQLALALHREQLVTALRRQADELEERVAQRTAELREANGELSQFATTVAHDLRAPLRTMRGFSIALLEDHAAALGGEGADFAQRIVAGAESMDRLIDDLLAYARTGPGTEVPLAAVDLEAVVADALERVGGEIRRSGAHITVERPLGHALGAGQLLVVVIANLVQNAVTFVQGTTPEIRIRVVREHRSVLLHVDDNGIGVPEKDRERIFTVFERLHPHHVFPGTGVGLAIVAKAAARMGGSAGVDGREGGGSSFWVRLRAVEEGEPE